MRSCLMQIKMATVNPVVFASGLILFGLLVHAAEKPKNPCDPIDNCLGKKPELPACIHHSEALTCLEKLASSSQCPKGQNRTNQLHKYVEGYSLAEATLCAENDLLTGFKNNRECWFPIVQCSQLFHFEVARKPNDGLCQQRHWVVEDCKKIVNPRNPACTDIHVALLDKMFEASPCGCSAVTVQMVVLGFGILLALVWDSVVLKV